MLDGASSAVELLVRKFYRELRSRPSRRRD
jgi:hypothetical protein